MFGGISTTLDERLKINMALFYYDYINMQVNRNITVPGQGGFISIRQNAGESTIMGVEVELQFAPVKNWYISAGLGYTHAEFDTFLSERADGDVDDFSGFPIPNVPEINSNFLLSYNHPLKSGAKIEFSTDWNYQDKYFVDSNFSATDIGEARSIGNLNLRYHSANDKWKFTAYARNITDNTYVVNRRNFGNALEGFLVIHGAPRVFGVTFDLNL